jgi:cell division initiation protein
MKITPIDIRQQQFGRKFRGLDPHEVDSFLNLASDELESAQRDINRLREELARSNRVVDEYHERERTLKETMITAQKITEDMKEDARKEAELIISRAELQAEKIIHAANDRLVKIIEDINEMKRQREGLKANLIGIVEAHRRLLLEVNQERTESLFLSIEELRQRRALLHAAIREALEAHANQLGLERNHESEELREEVERLQHQQTALFSHIQNTINTHTKLLTARQEAETRSASFNVEEKIMFMKQAKPPELDAAVSSQELSTRNEIETHK